MTLFPCFASRFRQFSSGNAAVSAVRRHALGKGVPSVWSLCGFGVPSVV